MDFFVPSFFAPRHRRASLLSTGVVNRSRVLDTLVNNLEGMAYRCLNDAHWTMVFVSQGCAELTGYAPAQLLGASGVSWVQIIHPEDRQRVRGAVQSAVANGQRFAVQYRITT